ncbi:MAG TPA: prolipoprotein diacylglyceryl transferase [Anaerolineales bacterium]|nr:prolipoprotein diacylglyceryl transferase [Anaerolineales bacterium]
MPPSGFFVGPVYIRFYGILIMLGAVAAAFMAEHEAKRRKLNSEFVWDALILVLIGGIIGARLWHIFTPPPSMLVLDPTTGRYINPYFINGTPQILDILSIWKGGLGIPGAVIGGAIALFFYCRRRKMSFLMWADIAVPGVALAQAVGRWGNFFNQELYGKPSTLPWAIYIDPNYRVPGYTQYSTFQPLFLYESLWNLLNMGLLLFLERRFPDKLKNGDLLLIYAIGYPIGRIGLEFLKLDAPRIGTININQTFMMVVLVVSAALLIWRHRKGAAQKVDAGVTDSESNQ